MASVTFLPPLSSPFQVAQELRNTGLAVLTPSDVALWAGCALEELQELRPDWNALASDEYLKDGGRYRRRRHSCFVVLDGDVQQVAHRAHWQPIEYNALHGGMERWFEPLLPATVQRPVWAQLLRALAALSDAVFAPALAPQPWFIEAHQFRIDTTDGIGRPTPEGAHRDGVDLVAVFLVERSGVRGGETRVFEANARTGQRFTLTQPWSLMLLDDARMVHESTPILPVTADGGHRDTLVITCRRGGFQGSHLV